jgi:hypothetical protein
LARTDAYDVVICLQLVMPPSIPFRAMLFGVAAIHFFVCNLTEVGYLLAVKSTSAAHFFQYKFTGVLKNLLNMFYASKDRKAASFFNLTNHCN